MHVQLLQITNKTTIISENPNYSSAVIVLVVVEDYELV
jgi:hypothetical protein